MEKDLTKLKTISIVFIFVLIILVSGYVVVSKAINRDDDSDTVNDNDYISDTVIKDSTIITELSLKNKRVKELYDYIDDVDIDYLAYKTEDEINWDMASFIVTKQLKTDDDLVNRDDFEFIYNKIFLNNLDELEKTSNKCGTASLIESEDLYKINSSCSSKSNIEIVTFLKNITLSDNLIRVNKYYAFVDRHFDYLNELSLYTDDSLGEDNMLASGIAEKDITKYISNMNIMSYVYKRDKKGVYYLYKIEK